MRADVFLEQFGRIPGDDDPLQLDFFEDGLGWYGEEEWLEQDEQDDDDYYDDEEDDDTAAA